ncbi:hypothetical protein RJ639_007101 [Escallonia herrerae]|uniref:Uncharacterized protein n=1 Tax=Escallonia herrerae TaxID=1293975 RepID=A0AA89AZ40_9ASTE|nr:hypothetical protein RJ639_007101 [Escallonia herrerae]
MKSSRSPLYYSSNKVLEEVKVGENANTSYRENTAAVATVKKVGMAGQKRQPLEGKPSEDIDESAEAFIRKFRQQLVIQRLESIENYERNKKRGYQTFLCCVLNIGMFCYNLFMLSRNGMDGKC